MRLLRVPNRRMAMLILGKRLPGSALGLRMTRHASMQGMQRPKFECAPERTLADPAKRTVHHSAHTMHEGGLTAPPSRIAGGGSHRVRGGVHHFLRKIAV